MYLLKQRLRIAKRGCREAESFDDHCSPERRPAMPQTTEWSGAYGGEQQRGEAIRYVHKGAHGRHAK